MLVRTPNALGTMERSEERFIGAARIACSTEPQLLLHPATRPLIEALSSLMFFDWLGTSTTKELEKLVYARPSQTSIASKKLKYRSVRLDLEV